MANMTPSRIARAVAAAEWPDVQAQHRVAPGIFWFSCAGHGGAVAVLKYANLPAQAVQAARATNKIELAAVGPRRILTSLKYVPESMREWARQVGGEVFECWVGEEDCDWATIALVSPAMRKGLTQQDGTLTEQEVRECCERWNKPFLAALETFEDEQAAA